jgi:hypothetical protein
MQPSVAKQRHLKHVSAATEADAAVDEMLKKSHATVEELLGAVFSVRDPRGYVPGTERGCCQWLAVEMVSENAGKETSPILRLLWDSRPLAEAWEGEGSSVFEVVA